MLTLRSAIAEVSSSSASGVPLEATTFFPAPDETSSISPTTTRHQYIDDAPSSPRPPTSTCSSSLWALAKDTTVDNTTFTSTDEDERSPPGMNVQYLRIEVLHSANLPKNVRLLDLTIHTVCIRLSLKTDWKERVCVLPIQDLPSDGQALTLHCQLLTCDDTATPPRLVREGSVELAAVFCFVRTSKMVQLPFSMVHTIPFHDPGCSGLINGEAQIKLTFTNQVSADDVLAEEVPLGTVPPPDEEDASHSEVTNWDDLVRTLPQPILVESATTPDCPPDLARPCTTSVQETLEFTLSLSKLVVDDTWSSPPRIASVQVTIGDLTGESRMAQLEFDRNEYDLLTDFTFPLIVEKLGKIRKPYAPQTVMHFIVRNPENGSSGKLSGSGNSATLRGRAKFRQTLERFLRLDFLHKAIAFEIPVGDYTGLVVCRLLCTLRVAGPTVDSGSSSCYWDYEQPPQAYCLPNLLLKLSGAVSSFQPTAYCEASIAPYVIVYAEGHPPMVSCVVVAPIARSPGDMLEYLFPGTFEFDFESTRSHELRFEIWSHGGNFVNSRLGEGRCQAKINDYSYHSVQIRNPMETTIGYLSVSLQCHKID